MEKKKVPMRTCIACRAEKPKRELVRVVKFGENISLDTTGKANGRGAYVCNDKECIAKLKKQKLLNRAFSCQVSDEIYDKIMEEFLGKQD
ncbi:MAG: YlxR family protein [Clostridiales bacterium]|nr:YlxR family protein [Clostridiales bacterium]MBQ3046548.1 YlxR family protein [Clostridia bacterium]